MEITNFFLHGDANHQGGPVRWTPADANELTLAKIEASDEWSGDGAMLWPVPGSDLSDFLLESTNRLLEVMREQYADSHPAHIAVIAHRQVVEIGVNTFKNGQGRPCVALYCRVAAEGEVTSEIRMVSGDLVDVTEHWMIFKRGWQGYSFSCYVHHTSLRQLNFARDHWDIRDGLRGHGVEYSKRKKDGIFHQLVNRAVWKRCFLHNMWASNTQRPIPRSEDRASASGGAGGGAEEGPQPGNDLMIRRSDLREDGDNFVYLVPDKAGEEGSMQYKVGANFLITQVHDMFKWRNQEDEQKSGCIVELQTQATMPLQTHKVLLTPEEMENIGKLHKHFQNEVGLNIFCNGLRAAHVTDILRPLYTAHANNSFVKTAVTVMGRQATKTDALDDCKDFVFGNCVLQVGGNYSDLVLIQNSKYQLVDRVFNQNSKRCFGKGNYPRLKLLRDAFKRQQLAAFWYNGTQTFHKSNVCPALWAQALMWASLSFLEWISIDRCFPIIYLLSTQHGIGKTTTMNALCASVGLPAEVVTGNKSSESGVLT